MNLWRKSWIVTIQMEATGTFLWYCFNIVLYKLVLTFKSANKVTVQMEADEQYFHLVQFSMR